MADVSALLAQYLSVKTQINYYQLEESKYANLHQNMSAMLSKQTKAESNWESSSGTMYDKLTGGEEVNYNGKGGPITNAKDNKVSDELAQKKAKKYADAKVPNYDPDKLEEYAALDMEYDIMQSTYDTLLEELNAQAESLKTQLSNGTKDTGMLE